MRATSKKTLYSLFFSLIVFWGMRTVSAQSIWLERSHDKTIVLEILKPDFERENRTTFATSSWFLSGRFPLSAKINITAELPFSYYKLDVEDVNFMETEGQSALGNPYLGFEFYNENRSVFGEIGLRLPLTPDEDAANAQYSGVITEFVERTEAFTRDILPICALINYMKAEDSGFMFRLRGGPVAWIATGERNESEWFLIYSLQGGYQSEKFNVLAGISGRWFMSVEDVTFGEATFHQFGVAANVVLGTFKPGIILKFPLDEDLGNLLDLVFGLTLGFNLN